MKLLALGEVLMLARAHVQRLEPHERRRLVELLRSTHGRPSSLTRAQREELQALIEKAEPRAFAGAVADKLSPFPLPRRFSDRR